MQRIKVDLSGIKGLVSGYSRTPDNITYLSNEGFTVSGLYNPFVYPGFIAPARQYSKQLVLTNIPNQQVTCIFDKSSGIFLTTGMDGYTNRFIGTAGTSTALDMTTYSAGVNTANNLPVYDYEIYQLNGSRKIFYTSFDVLSGNAYIGVTNGTDFQYNWSNGATNAFLYTGTVSGAGTFPKPIFLRNASNNYMYAFITGSGSVAKIDGTTSGGTAGTITPLVLTIPNKQIIDAVDWRNTMYIAIQDNYGSSAFAQYNNGEHTDSICGVYMWDRVSTTVGIRDYIPLQGINYISRIFNSHDGKLRLICVTSGGFTQLREFNGSTFEIIFELPLDASPVWWDSLTTSDYATFWVGQNKIIYAYGKPQAGMNNGLYQIGYLTPNTVQKYDIGFVYYANGYGETSSDALFIHYRDSTSGTSYVKKYLINYNSPNTLTSYTGKIPVVTSVIKTPVHVTPFMSSVEDIVVFFAPITGTGDSTIVGDIKVYFNMSSTAFKTKSITRADLAKGYIRIPINKQYVTSFQIGIDYSTTSATVDGISGDMIPWYAYLDVNPTTTNQ